MIENTILKITRNAENEIVSFDIILHKNGYVTESGAIYLANFWEEQIEQVNDKVSNRMFIGKLGRNSVTSEGIESSLDQVSHLITKMWMDGDYLMGTVEIIPNWWGKLLRNYMELGCYLRVRPAAFCELDENKNIFNYNLIAFDLFVNNEFKEYKEGEL